MSPLARAMLGAAILAFVMVVAWGLVEVFMGLLRMM